MRRDMSKVVSTYRDNQRTKRKGWVRPRQVSADLPAEFDTTRERMRHNVERSLTRHKSNPLKRLLNRRVGRRWDAVFAEICEWASPHNYSQKTIRDNVRHLVVEHPILRDGVPGRGWNKHWSELSNNALYICPTTGILRRHRRLRQHPTKANDVQLVGQTMAQARRRNGVWYLVVFQERQPPAQSTTPAKRLFDVWLGRSVPLAGETDPLFEREALAEYGRRDWFVKVKRRLSPTEVRLLEVGQLVIGQPVTCISRGPNEELRRVGSSWVHVQWGYVPDTGKPVFDHLARRWLTPADHAGQRYAVKARRLGKLELRRRGLSSTPIT